MRRHIFSLAILLALGVITSAQQPTSPEDLAFTAVRAATNPASRLAAAEDFVANFPNSTKRPDVAKLVSEQLSVLRNPAIAITLLDRARTIFTSENEWEQLKIAALDVYLNADRVEQAFELGADILSRKPSELSVLIKLTNLGAQEARNKNLNHADTSLRFGFQAIKILEQNEKPSGLTDQQWSSQKTQLPLLYQVVAVIQFAEGNSSEAKEQLNKAIALDPREASNFGLLGRILNSDYDRRVSLFETMPDGNTKLEEKKQLDLLLDEIVDAYAHAAGLATGKVRYQVMLQQLIPDLTRLYRVRHNLSTNGLQQLIDKYRIAQ